MRELGQELDIVVSEKGLPIKVERSEEEEIYVSLRKGEGIIRYKERIHFFRALGLLIESLRVRDDFEICEDIVFSMNGGMFDCSRNAVMKVETAKTMLRKMALMGLNLFMLYTEDTYEVREEPLFGYFRGRYTEDELRAIDDYAHLFGIEVIPCIQTLAHLATFLKWNSKKSLRDTLDVLLVEQEETYAFIERMIAAASKPLRSRRIHIGMDEAHGLGRDRYLDLHGYKRRYDLMIEHLNRVICITDKYDLKPMIWSDMFFRIASPNQLYYDAGPIPQDVINAIPKDVELVYWDYYHNDRDFYEGYLQRHLEFGNPTLFAGVTWTFTGHTTHYDKTFMATNAALTACKLKGIREVFTTMWMDNGAENNYFSSLLGLQLYAEHGYSRDLDEEKLRKRFEFCTGGNYDAFRSLGKADTPPKAEWAKYRPDNPVKFLLWQDILLGLFDKHLEGLDLKGYYDKLAKRHTQDAEQAGAWASVFDIPAKLCTVLSQKSDMGLRLKKAYDKDNRNELARMTTEELPRLSEAVEALRVAHREQWHAWNKPHGWEVLDIRYGGVKARIDTAAARIKDYLEGRVARLEELEEERLFYDALSGEPGEGIGRETLYHRIATTNVMG